MLVQENPAILIIVKMPPMAARFIPRILFGVGGAALANIAPIYWAFPLTVSFDILQFGPGWRATECNSIN
jgi:hypothetical protein